MIGVMVQLTLLKLNTLLSHKLLDDRDVNTMAQVDEGVVIDLLPLAVDADFLALDVEAEVEVLGGELHALHHALVVE